MIRSLHQLLDFSLADADGQLGAIQDVYVDDALWVVRYLVVEPTSLRRDDWFLVSPIAVERVASEERNVLVQLPRERLETAPGIDLDKPVSASGESHYYDHFGWPYYWQGGALWGGTMTPMPAVPPTVAEAVGERGPEGESVSPAASSDRHLRSVSEMTGYHVRASDDEIGHVEDFLVDEGTWRVTHVVIDTSNWPFGKRVAVPIDAVDQVTWSEGKVFVSLTCDEIRHRRAYDEDDPGQVAA